MAALSKSKRSAEKRLRMRIGQSLTRASGGNHRLGQRMAGEVLDLMKAYSDAGPKDREKIYSKREKRLLSVCKKVG